MNPFAARRARLIAQMHAKGGGVAIIATAPEVHRNSDAEYPYRHDSSFYYLSGFAEPEALIVIVAGATNLSILFCRDKNMEREIWEGFRYGPEAAREKFGFDAAYCIDAIDTIIPTLLANRPAVFYALGSHAALDAQIQKWLRTVRAQSRTGITAPTTAHDITGTLHEMRLIKDDSEVAIMQRAAAISSGAHARAMREAAPGLHEYQIEAELLHEFRRHGSDFPAYTSIVATGANACVLHYRAGNAVLQNGDLVLIDAGCELDGYASDITRTFPASGRFSAAQKTLYQIVLDAQTAAFAATGPGKRFVDGHDAALRVLSQGMLDTGLLDADKVGTVDDVINTAAYRQFYMHRTGHWLGMDVHDVGGYHEVAEAPDDKGNKPSRILHPGMTLTVEPGLYVRPAPGVPEQFWHIGIRIEDDVTVTDSGIDILSTAPKTIAEIEAVMAR
jgi:Xaa-Pro aminopeptidase